MRTSPDSTFTYLILSCFSEHDLQVDLSRVMGPGAGSTHRYDIVYMGPGPEGDGIVILEAETSLEIFPPPYGVATLTLESTAKWRMKEAAERMSSHGSKGYRFKGLAPRSRAGGVVILMVR